MTLRHRKASFRKYGYENVARGGVPQSGSALFANRRWATGSLILQHTRHCMPPSPMRVRDRNRCSLIGRLGHVHKAPYPPQRANEKPEIQIQQLLSQKERSCLCSPFAPGLSMNQVGFSQPTSFVLCSRLLITISETDLTRLRQRNEYETALYWCHQLFFPGWRATESLQIKDKVPCDRDLTPGPVNPTTWGTAIVNPGSERRSSAGLVSHCNHLSIARL